MANASPDLIWGVVRDTSCHILKARQSGRTKVMGKRGAEFTLEPNNPTGINSWKYSGLANAKTVDVTPVEGGVLLTTKSKDAKRIGKVSAQLADHKRCLPPPPCLRRACPFLRSRGHRCRIAVRRLAHLCVAEERRRDVAATGGRNAPSCAALLARCSPRLWRKQCRPSCSRVVGPPPLAMRSRRRRSTRPPSPRISAASPRSLDLFNRRGELAVRLIESNRDLDAVL